MKWLIFLFLFSFCTSNSDLVRENPTNTENITNSDSPEHSCVSSQEKELLEAINSYRKSKGLKAIPYSESMSIVARQHAKELNNKIKKVTHDWVDCKYVSGKRESYNCMWDKPKELTGYPGKGYECAYGKWGTTPISPKKVLQKWKDSPMHNNMIVNEGSTWSKATWKSMGVGIYGDYAVLWFGKVEDPKGKPSFCK